jgi:hypothetical protein
MNVQLYLKRRLAKGTATAIIVGGTMLIIEGIFLAIGIGSMSVLNVQNLQGASGALVYCFPVFLLFELWLLGFVLEFVDKNRWMNRL